MKVLFIASMIIFASLLGCSKSDDPSSPSQALDSENSGRNFVTGTTNPPLASELSFESLVVPVTEPKNAVEFSWDHILNPLYNSLVGLAQLPPAEHIQVQGLDTPGDNYLCSPTFDPMRASDNTNIIGDLALARLYLCSSAWKSHGEDDQSLDLDTLVWSCNDDSLNDPNANTATQDVKCEIGLQTDSPQKSVSLPISLSSLLHQMNDLALNNEQILFLVNHVEASLSEKESLLFADRRLHKAPRYKDLPLYVQQSDRIELFSFEDDALLKSRHPSLRSYWFHRRDLISNYYSELASTDVLIELILRENDEALKKVARNHAANEVSQLVASQGINTIPSQYGTLSRRGLSPLMVSTLLQKNASTKILLKTPGIRKAFESPLYQTDYQGLRQWTPEQFRPYILSGAAAQLPGGEGPSDPSLPGGEASFAHDPLKNIFPDRQCSNCTPLMRAIVENQCASLSALAQNDATDINFESKNGISALGLAQEKDQCLLDLVGLGVNIKKNKLYLEWVEDKRADLFQNLPPSLNFWSQLSQGERDEVLLMLLSQKGISQRVFEGTYLYKAADIVNTIGRQGFEDLALSRKGLLLLIFYNINPDDFRNTDDVSLMDRFFSERNLEFLESIRNEKPEWLTAWVNGQNFYGHNPFVLSVVFSENDLVKFLLTIDDIDIYTTDLKTGKNAFQWNALLHSKSVNFESRKNDQGTFPGYLKSKLSLWLGDVFFDTMENILTDHADEERPYDSAAEDSGDFNLESYKSFFEGDCRDDFEIKSPELQWLGCYPMTEFSKETRVVFESNPSIDSDAEKKAAPPSQSGTSSRRRNRTRGSLKKSREKKMRPKI